MNIVVKIQGREAIPIRAIPLLTDWEVLSPDVCAKAFAGDEISAQHFENMPTYQLDENGSYAGISSRWWANWVVRELDACAERTQADGISDEVGYALWRSESIELLPAGTFVWRNEFEAAYQAEYGPESMRVICSKEAYEADTYDLNFNPVHGPRDDWQAVVMEGFEAHFAGTDDGVRQSESAPVGVVQGAESFDIRSWAQMSDVSALEASNILSGFDPFSSSGLAEGSTEKMLRRIFEDAVSNHPGKRRLVDWVRIAKERAGPHSAERADAVLSIEPSIAAKSAAVGKTTGKGKWQEKRWTPEFIAEVRAYREEHGLKKTAIEFEVSQTTIGNYVPAKKMHRPGLSAFDLTKPRQKR